jgi:hypothetical protein
MMKVIIKNYLIDTEYVTAISPLDEDDVSFEITVIGQKRPITIKQRYKGDRLAYLIGEEFSEKKEYVEKRQQRVIAVENLRKAYDRLLEIWIGENGKYEILC